MNGSAWMERWRMRRRLRAELRQHCGLRRRALRRAGWSWWRAWWRTRIRAADRAALVASCEAAWLEGRDGGGLRAAEWLRLPGVLPLLLWTAALGMLWAGPFHPLVRYSLLGRLPWPGTAALQIDSEADGIGRQFGVTNGEPCAAAFRYARVIWRGPHGDMPVTALQGTPAFFAAVGLAGVAPQQLLASADFLRAAAPPEHATGTLRLDYRAYAVAGRLPDLQRRLFPQAQIWMVLPADASLRVFRLDRHPLAVAADAPRWPLWLQPAHRPFIGYLLVDLSYARWACLALLMTCLGMAAGDLIGLARSRPDESGRLPRLLHAGGYWAYALTTAAGLGLLLCTLSGYFMELSPRLGVAGSLPALPVCLLLGYELLRWCRDDHRYRCRTCLRRLRLPREQGRWGGILLAAPACEYICAHGHGRLLVPARADQTQPLERWNFSGDWWSELISGRPTAA